MNSKMSIHRAIKDIVRENDNKINSISTLSLKRKIYDKYRKNGQPNRPLDASILRQLRALREECYIVECIDNRKSKYRIEKEGVKDEREN